MDTVETAETNAAEMGPVVLCITRTAEERTRLARMFDGVGVLVMTSDPDSASSFLERFHDGGPAPGETQTADASGVSGVVRVGGLRLDLNRHEASWHGRALRLTAHEMRVLSCLARSPGRVWTYEQLHEHAWEETYFSGPAAVQSVIKRLRAKMRRLKLPVHVETVRGLGFRLNHGNELHLVS